MKKKRKKLDAVQVVSLLLCLFGVLICLYPMYYVFIMSISDPIEAATGVYFLPKKYFWEATRFCCRIRSYGGALETRFFTAW